MKLMRDGREVSPETYIKSTNGMKRIQNAADRIVGQTPQLAKHIGSNNLIQPQKGSATEQTLIQPNKKQEILESYKQSSTGKKQSSTNQQQIQQIKNEMSPVDWQRRCTDLQNILEKEKEEKQLLILDLNNRQERFVKREIEYRKIIEDLQNELRSKSNLDVQDRKLMDEIITLHGAINENISSIQLKTSKIMVDQEKDIMRFFINKINEIKKEYEEERIRKGKKDQDYLEKESQLIKELEWIKNIAQKIDNENHTLMKKYMDLKAQYQTQENDREMLLKELIMKKKKNAILKSQIEQYEKLLNEVSKDIDTNDQNAEENQSQAQSINSSKHHAFDKEFSHNNSPIKKLQESQVSKQQQITESGKMDERIYRYEQTIKNLKATVNKEQKRSMKLKTLYIKQVEEKNELEKILRKCIDDVKEEILKVKSQQKQNEKKKQNDDWNKEQRAQIIERLLNNEKVLTLIYDKTFYPDFKNIEILNNFSVANALEHQQLNDGENIAVKSDEQNI